MVVIREWWQKPTSFFLVRLGPDVYLYARCGQVRLPEGEVLKVDHLGKLVPQPQLQGIYTYLTIPVGDKLAGNIDLL
jgi:hypothetical protein